MRGTLFGTHENYITFFVINTSAADRKIAFNQSQLTSFTAHVSLFNAKNIDWTLISFKKLLNFLVFLSYGFIPETEGSILAFIAADVKLIVQRENLVFSVLNFLELIGKIVSLSAHYRSQVGYSSSHGVMGCWTRLLAWYRTWDWFVFKCSWRYVACVRVCTGVCEATRTHYQKHHQSLTFLLAF